MPLNTFGWTDDAVTTDRAGNVKTGVELTVYADEDKTTQVTQLYADDGTTLLAKLLSDTEGRFGFKAADAYSLLYIFGGSSTRPYVLAAHEVLDAGSASVEAAAAAAQASATAAQNAANLVGAPADTAVNTLVTPGSGSVTEATLNSTYAAKWKPNTNYTAGDLVISPLGLIVSANATFTSGATYNSANWTVVPGMVKVTDGGNAAGAGTGGPTRPNVQIGGVLNGTTIQTDQIHGVILQPGGPGYNNIIGGDGSATVGTTTPNVASAVGNCGVSLIGGYDNVAGQISSKIISDHSYTEAAPAGQTAPGHNLIMGGHGHVIRWAASHSAVAGGETNDVGGSDSLTSGFQNVNNGATSIVTGASNTLAASSGSAVAGQLNNVQSSYARVSGYGNIVDAVALFAEMHGANGKARSPFNTVRSSGKISADGDAQSVSVHYRGQSTSATAVLLIAAYTGVGSNSQYLMVQGQSVLVKAEVIARIVGGATVGAWTIQGVAQWQTGAGAPVWLGGTAPTPTAIYTNGSGAAPALLLGAGGSAGRMFVQCAGVAATTINWSTKFTTVEVMA